MIDVSDSENFLASSNLFEIAIKHGFFIPEPASSNPLAGFNFAVVYGNNRHSTGFACTRRIWCATSLTLALT